MRKTHPRYVLELKRNYLAKAYDQSRQPKESIKAWTSVVEGLSKLYPAHNDTLLTSRQCLAWAYHKDGQEDKAIDMFQSIIDIQKQRYPSHRPEVLWPRYRLAWLYRSRGQGLKAIDIYEDIISIARKHNWPELSDFLFETKCNLAKAYYEAGEIGKAIDLLVDTIHTWSPKYQPDSPQIKKLNEDLAEWLEKQNA